MSPPAALSPLAQSVDTGAVLLWSFLLIALIVLMFLAVGWLKKWMKADDADAASSKIGFTLGDLRRMADQGQITQEEFDRARAQMIAATKRAAERDAERAAEAAKERGASAGTVTDVEEIRRRARQHRAAATGANGAPPSTDAPPADPTPPADSPPL